ncbi:hypothetical protein FQZ97_908930 [compost metagenome]
MLATGLASTRLGEVTAACGLAGSTGRRLAGSARATGGSRLGLLAATGAGRGARTGFAGLACVCTGFTGTTAEAGIGFCSGLTNWTITASGCSSSTPTSSRSPYRNQPTPACRARDKLK